MLRFTHKMAHLNQIEIYDELCSKKAIQTNDGDKWPCEILQIADLLNSENLIKIQTQPKLSLNMYYRRR